MLPKCELGVSTPPPPEVASTTAVAPTATAPMPAQNHHFLKMGLLPPPVSRSSGPGGVSVVVPVSLPPATSSGDGILVGCGSGVTTIGFGSGSVVVFTGGVFTGGGFTGVVFTGGVFT